MAKILVNQLDGNRYPNVRDIRNVSPTEVQDALQDALLLRGHIGLFSEIGEPETIYINSSFRIYSNTWLEIGPDITIKRANGTNLPMLRNDCFVRHLASERTTITIAWTAGNIATVTWTAHGLTSENYVWIQGASDALYNNVYRVAEVVNANSFIIVLPEVPTASPTGTITAMSCDTNIKIFGGLWDGNIANNTSGDNAVRDCFYLIGMASSDISCNFKNIHRGITSGALADVRIHDQVCTTDETAASDCHKTFGPINGLVLENLRYRSTDDGMSVQTKEAPAFSWTGIPFGDIRNLTIRNVHVVSRGMSAAGGLSLYCSDSENMYGVTIDQLVAHSESGVGGISVLYGNTFTTGYINDLVLRNAWVSSGTDHAVHIVATVKDLTLESVRPRQSASTALYPVYIAPDTAPNRIKIKDLQFNNSSYPSNLGNSLIRIKTADVVEFEDCYCSGNATNGNFLELTGDIKSIAFRNCNIQSWLRCLQLTGGTLKHLHLENSYFKTSTSLVEPKSATTPMKAVLVNCEFDTITRIFRPSTGTGVVLQIYGHGNTLVSTSWTAATGSATWESYTFDVSGDPIALTSTGGLAATVGQMLTSTQASTEGGPAVLTPAGWVALGTGAAGVNTVIT